MRFPILVLTMLFTTAGIGAEPLRFRITLDPAIAPQGASGRLFVLVEKSHWKRERLSFGFLPEGQSGVVREVQSWAPGDKIEMDAAENAWPKPLTEAAHGEYSVMALLDVDHSFSRNRQDSGDLYSEVVQVRDLSRIVELRLTKVTPTPTMDDTLGVQYVELPSKLISNFLGHPVSLRAAIVLPPQPEKGLPAVFRIHGFGGDYRDAWTDGPEILRRIAAGDGFRAAHIFLDANCPGGHHAFADSANNGPWGQALTTELIPYLEQRFALGGQRFLTGHSSGGWTSLWLQVRYPDFFHGAWATAPDSVDFRNFTGINATPGSLQNAYRAPNGKPLNLVRRNGQNLMTMEEFVRMEQFTGEVGGQMSSFDWVFSPRGANGKPAPLFDRKTGVQDKAVQEYWQRWDIGRILRQNWATLGPKLAGKLHLTVGADDNFHLNESAELFCKDLQLKGVCEFVPGRDHFNLFRSYTTYPDGLAQRIDTEMRRAWERPTPKPTATNHRKSQPTSTSR